MSLETLLEAARFVEQQEKKRERLASSSSSSSDHPLAVAPHSNHHNSNEPRGAKLKRDRTEQDDLFCEEKMLIIDEEEPLENNKTNGNHSTGSRGSPVISSTRITPPSATANPSHLTALHTVSHHHLPHHQQHQQQQQQQQPTPPPTQQQQQQQQQQQPPLHHHHHHHNNHNSTHNPYVENHNSNHTQQNAGNLVVDVETNHDSKKHRNGPCVIRSGTREVHNKLEKNRRAHLKECFELLKRQLPSQDEKKSSNLSILHAAIRHIQTLRRKERDYEHEMERLAREKIAAQQRLLALKKELAATWDHIDFNTLLPEQNSATDVTATKSVSENMEVDVTGLARGGTRYSSTSSLSSAATASSPQTLQTTSSTASNIHNQVATAAVVCQTQGLNLAQSSRESPPASSSPGTSTPSIPTPAQEKVNTSPTGIVQQPHQLHLPISAQMLNTNQGLATIVPTLQHLGPSLRVIPGDTRQLLVAHTAGNNESRPLTLAVQNSADQSRPLIAVQSNTGSEPRPVALVVHSSTANDNRVTFVHSNLSNNDRSLALAVQSSANDVRPVTFVHSANEGRPLVLAAHSPALNVSNAQTRIRAGDAQTTHKMVGGVTLVGGNGSELTRLPGGAELNILPANGLTLSHAGVSLQATTGKPGSTVMQNAPSTEGIAHIVGPHTPISGLTPIVTPMTVVSQGNQVTAHILAPSSLAGKIVTTPILKSVAQMPIVNAQYINTTTLVKPVVVVSSPSTSAPQSTTASSTQPSSTTHSTV
ncbi:PREDICTED: flocculation protein FLO11-like [Dufourea novaeangliae]|uniref:flocculation protein FLO11-like n=1 Tax=Dufourea novaeangliae TaxID=178035 RepID=UPI000766E8E0|nr:PREDICTED: flocculation protein FLO11-like [Dufourea novaeangliae]XP_015431247.1 PREDICTED: flocculation protein FLO11-like [Dufourea novaeangliae]